MGLIFVFLLFFQIFTSYGGGLEQLIKNIGVVDFKTFEREFSNLTQEDRIKLHVLLLTYAGHSEEAKRIVDEMYSEKIISNVLLLPGNEKAIVVDKTNEVLYVVSVRSGVPYIERKFVCVTGKRPGDKLEEGDLRTPEGIYFPLYWDSNLPSKYGIGAFPLNYPNIIDGRILRRNGHGIWIHGMDSESRPPHSTNGCIVLRNSDLAKLKKLVKPRLTPVVVVSKLSFSSKDGYIDEQKSILNFIMKWKKAWENSPKDIYGYLALYSKDFVWKKGNCRDWIRYKRRITRSKKWIKLDISNVSILKDGRLLEFGNLYVVRLDFDYRSNNFNSKGRKLLYVVRKGKTWEILGEENL